MNWIARLFVIALIFTSCGDSNSIHKVDTEKVELGVDSLKTKVETPIKEDSIAETKTPFLDITFIENLEASWKSSYKNAVLALKGFSQKSSDNSEEKVFTNKTLGNKLVLSKVNFHGGGSNFNVEYNVSEEQFELFKMSLIGTSYRLKTSGLYKKKGLGTYMDKTIRMNPNSFSIIYGHYMGKETSMPPLLPLDSIPIILPIDSILRMR